MGYSRITLATLLALGLLGTVQADESGQDPFYVELKGPDDAAPPLVVPQAKSVAPATQSPKAQPMVRQGHPILTAQTGSYGPIHPTDTLWSLANKYRPSSLVSVYQTMVAIYEKNPRSFADGNINHILVGSRILLPSAAEASRISDAEARRRFKSDNASWKGLSPKYLASKHPQPVKLVAAKPAASIPVPKAAAPKDTTSRVAPIPAATAEAAVPAPAPEATVKAVDPGQLAATSAATATSAAIAAAPALLPAESATPVGKPATEMALALEDANAQLGQVTEMNQRLKSRLQSLTEEVETLKARLQDQTVLQKEVAELKTKPVPPVVTPEPEQNWLMTLFASPLNLAMIILLPVLLVLALVTLWLRARTRRELEEQEQSLSSSTAMVMDEESSECDPLRTVGITDDEPMRATPDHDTPASFRAMEEPSDLIFRDDGDSRLPDVGPETAGTSFSREPALVPELDLAHEDAFELTSAPALDASEEAEPFPLTGSEPLTEESRQAALFAELDAQFDTELDTALTLDHEQESHRDRRAEDLANFDLSDFESDFGEPTPDKGQGGADGYGKQDVDDMLVEWGLDPVQDKTPELAWDPDEPDLADVEDSFAEVTPHTTEVKPPLVAAQPGAQWQANGYVEIEKLLAEANASRLEQEPYQGFSLDVGLDGFPEVLPQSNGFDVDADDGGVGAKLDLARAYLEIDDRESARELLQEAAAQGSERQRSEAGKLLKRLGATPERA